MYIHTHKPVLSETPLTFAWEITDANLNPEISNSDGRFSRFSTVSLGSFGNIAIIWVTNVPFHLFSTSLSTCPTNRPCACTLRC